MLRIGEFSQLGRVSVRTLRLYDELGLLKPARVDRFTDYRYYAIDQLPRLCRILALKDLGLSLEQIAGLLREDLPAERLQDMLTARRAELEQQLREGQARLARVEARIRQIEREGKDSGYEVALRGVGELRIASIRGVVPTLDEMARHRCGLFDAVYEWLAQHQITPTGPELALYHNSEYDERNIDMEAAVALGKSPDAGGPPPPGGRVEVRVLPATTTMASVIHCGSLPDVVDAITALFLWIGANNYSVIGPLREIHLFGREKDLGCGNSTVTLEVQIPVEGC